jgi:hypothetical protein
MSSIITSHDIRNKRLERNVFQGQQKTLILQSLKEAWQHLVPQIIDRLENHPKLGIQNAMKRFLNNPAMDNKNTFLTYVIFDETNQKRQQEALSLKIETWPEIEEAVHGFCEKYGLQLLSSKSYAFNCIKDDIEHYDIAFLFEFQLN